MPIESRQQFLGHYGHLQNRDPHNIGHLQNRDPHNIGLKLRNFALKLRNKSSSNHVNNCNTCFILRHETGAKKLFVHPVTWSDRTPEAMANQDSYQDLFPLFANIGSY
jgi:hypothetical protein